MFDFGQILNFLRFKCFDQFLFLSGVQDAGGEFKEWGVPSLFVCWCLEQGWALGNWRSDGAVFAIFNSRGGQI